MNRKQIVTLARQVTKTAIKNSEVIQDYVKPSHYRRIVFGLNALNMALKLVEDRQ